MEQLGQCNLEFILKQICENLNMLCSCNRKWIKTYFDQFNLKLLVLSRMLQQKCNSKKANGLYDWYIQTVINRIQNFKSMPSWDDQFDFDDLEDKKKKSKPTNKNNQKKANNYDEQFFDDQPQSTPKQTTPILPTINSRNSAKSKVTKQQPATKLNPYADKSFGSHNSYQNEEIVDEQLIVPKSNNSLAKPLKTEKSVQKLTKSKSSIADEYTEDLVQDEESFHQSVKKVQSAKLVAGKGDKVKTEGKQLNKVYEKAKLVKQEEEEDDDGYEEEFEENEEYAEEDFEEEAKSPGKTQNKQEPVKQQKTVPKQSLQLAENLNPPLKTNNLTVAAEINKPKLPPTKSTTSKPPVPSDKKNSKQQPSTSSNRNIHKISSQSVSKPLKRSVSRQSARSNDAKQSVQASRITQRNESEFFPNKHSDMVAKSFPHDQEQLTSNVTQMQVSKLNEKMRAMIRKFNDELNDLINKNMLLLKGKSSDTKQQYNVQDKVRELQIQKKSGETAIDVMQKDFDKLQGRQGELKQQEYQLILQKQIEQIKAQIKQATKYITTVKRDVDTRGKKLSVKQVEQRNAQSIHHLKTILIQGKKDEEKSDEKILKLTTTQEQLETKIADMDYKLDEVIAEAKEKGVSVQGNIGMVKKFEDLKAKLENGKNYNKKTDGLVTTKVDILNHENEQIKITIRNVSAQVQNVHGSIQHTQGETIKLIEKARQRTGVSIGFVESLDKLLRQLEEARTSNAEYNDARSEVKSRRSESTKTGKGGKGEESIEKSLPLRTTQSQNRLLDGDGGVVRPNFGKKKLLEVEEGHHAKLDIQNDKNKSQLPERVWKEGDNNNNNGQKQSNNHVHQHDESRRSVEQLPKKDTIDEEEKKDKSKPFMLKKNKPADNKEEIKEKSFQNSPVVNIPEKVITQSIPTKDEPKKEQINVILAPKMMRFGRKKNNDEGAVGNDAGNDNVQIQKVIDTKQSPKISPVIERKDNATKLEITEPVKHQAQVQQNAIFVPKRFNLRNKAEKKDDSYMPSVQRDTSNVTSANVQQVQSPVQKQQPAIKQEYKPKFDFKQEEFKPAIVKQEIVVKKQLQKPVEQTEVKPRFNLRLRDRANKNLEDDGGYVANIGEKMNLDGGLGENKKVEVKVETKVNIGGNEFIANKVADKQPVTNNVYNPYAPKIEPSNQLQGVKKIEPLTKVIPPQQQSNQPVINPVSNPYAVKFQSASENQPTMNQGVKRQRGPLKKNKPVNIPKENFNIYAQADDLTSEVKEIGGVKTANQAVYEGVNSKPTGGKKEELNLNEMLGIKKEVKKNDFDDLLGDVGVGNAKSKKKNNDFFSDMQF